MNTSKIGPSNLEPTNHKLQGVKQAIERASSCTGSRTLSSGYIPKSEKQANIYFLAENTAYIVFYITLAIVFIIVQSGVANVAQDTRFQDRTWVPKLIRKGNFPNKKRLDVLAKMQPGLRYDGHAVFKKTNVACKSKDGCEYTCTGDSSTDEYACTVFYGAVSVIANAYFTVTDRKNYWIDKVVHLSRGANRGIIIVTDGKTKRYFAGTAMTAGLKEHVESGQGTTVGVLYELCKIDSSARPNDDIFRYCDAGKEDLRIVKGVKGVIETCKTASYEPDRNAKTIYCDSTKETLAFPKRIINIYRVLELEESWSILPGVKGNNLDMSIPKMTASYEGYSFMKPLIALPTSFMLSGLGILFLTMVKYSIFYVPLKGKRIITMNVLLINSKSFLLLWPSAVYSLYYAIISLWPVIRNVGENSYAYILWIVYIALAGYIVIIGAVSLYGAATMTRCSLRCLIIDLIVLFFLLQFKTARINSIFQNISATYANACDGNKLCYIQKEGSLNLELTCILLGGISVAIILQIIDQYKMAKITSEMSAMTSFEKFLGGISLCDAYALHPEEVYCETKNMKGNTAVSIRNEIVVYSSWYLNRAGRFLKVGYWRGRSTFLLCETMRLSSYSKCALYTYRGEPWVSRLIDGKVDASQIRHGHNFSMDNTPKAGKWSIS